MTDQISIMVVEDDKTSRFLLTRILAGAGYKIMEAESASQALNLLAGPDLPDIIITDILMPVIDGLDFTERVQSNPRTRKIPIILCTSIHDKETVIRAGKLGITVYILKPFDSHKILRQVEKVLLKSASEEDEIPAAEKS